MRERYAIVNDFRFLLFFGDINFFRLSNNMGAYQPFMDVLNLLRLI